MKLLSSIVLVVVVLLLVLLSALPFTAAGTRTLVGWVDQLDGINVQYGSGLLFGDLELQHIRYENETLQLELNTVHVVLRPACFWRSAFCLDSANIEELKLRLLPGEDAPGEERTAQERMIELAYPVNIDRFELGSADIRWQGGHWQQGMMHASLALADSTLAIGESSVQSPRLLLTSDTEPGSSYAGFELPLIYLPLDLQVDQLDLLQPRFDINGLEYDLAFLGLRGRWAGYTLELAQVDTRAQQYGELTGSGELAFQGQWPLQVEATVLVTASDAPEQIRDRTVGLSLSGSLQQLMVSAHSPGNPILSVEGEAGVNLAGLPLSADWTLQWEESTNLADIAQIQGSLGELQLLDPLVGSVSGNLEEQQLELRGQLAGLGYERLELVASMGWQTPRLQLQSLTLSDSASDSRISAQGLLQISEAWELQASASSAGFQLPDDDGHSLARLEGSLSLHAEGRGDNWTIRLPDVQLQGVVADQPAHITGYAGVTSALRLLPSKLEGEVSGAQLNVDADDQGNKARVELVLDDIGRWLPGSRGQLTLLARGDPSRQHLEFQGRAQQLRLAGQELSHAELSGSYSVEREAMDVELLAAGIETGGLAIEQLGLKVRGSLDSHRIGVSVKGDLAGDLITQGSFTDGGWQGVLQPTLIATSSGDWRLSEQVGISWDPEPGALKLDQHCWKHRFFNFCGERLIFGSSGDVDLRLAGNARAINSFLPQGLRTRGELQADIQLGWLPQQRLTFQGKGSAADLRLTRAYGMGERVSTQWERLTLNVSGGAQGLELDARGHKNGREVFALNADLPLDRTAGLEGTLRLDQLSVDNLAPLTRSFSELGGHITGELQLSGSVDVPMANGLLTLTDGRFVSLDNPTELTGLQLELKLQGDSGTIAGEGLLGGGVLQLEGTVSLRPEYQLTLLLKGDRHQILIPPASDLVASQELRLVLTEELLEVTGEIRIHEGVLRHEELPAGGVALSSDAVLVDVSGETIKEEAPFDVRSDIWIRIRDRFRIEGESLRATLGGDLHVLREPGDPPQVFGTLNLMGGELRAYRQQLNVKRGTIAFSGPPENPELNISAEREIRAENVTVGARLIGQLEQPELEIYSTPAMSQGEAMSYLARGRGLDSGAGADGTALALSVGADIVNRSGIVREINRLPLISDVAFGASGDDDDTAATVSAYVGNRIYLSYGIGLYEPINILTARLYLQSRLWLEVVSSLENSLDLYYSFDID